ncbi:MAG: glycosyltransferase family 4 protein [Candidatus Promineifilaceae bacterium]
MVAPTSFFKDYGGHIRILEEATSLQNLGHSIAIVTYHMGDNMPGLTIRRTWPLPYRADYEVGSSRHKVTFDIYLWLKTIQVGLQFQPDLVHGHMHEGALIGGFIAKLLRVPLVFDFQGSLTSEMVDHGFLAQNGVAYSFVRKIEKLACRIPDAILTSSLHAKDLLIEEFDVDGDSIYPMPDCVDTVRFDPERVSDAEKMALKQNLGIPLGLPVVVYLGLLADYQGIPEIIKAAAALNGAGSETFFLVMGFPKSDHYQELANHLGVADRVLFTGKVQYRDAPRYLSLGDVAVSAKMSDTEGSGKVLNYMAMSIPVVAFDTTVHREYLAEHGVYAAVADYSALAKGIKALTQDSERAQSLGNELRLRAKKMYSWEEAGKKISSLYNLLTR